MSFTVVICTHNRANLLRKVLSSLNAAERPQTAIDILVVANACNDETSTVLASYASNTKDPLPLMWAEEPRPGKSFALNHAISILSTPTAVFIDDDHRVDATFLRTVDKALMQYPQAEMLCGRLVPDWDGNEPPWVHDSGPYRIYPPPIACFDAGNSVRTLSNTDTLPPGGNIIVRSGVFDHVGAFATHLGPRGHDLAGGEDIEFVLRALDTGVTLVYVPGIIQYHEVELARLQLIYLIRKTYQRSRAAICIIPRHRGGIPPYMWKKILIYLTKSLVSGRSDRRRFYLIRLAAALGELRGVMEAPVFTASASTL